MYQLSSSPTRVVKEGTLAEVMQELMVIAGQNSIPEVSANVALDATEFRFEGDYCYFSLYLKEIIQS